MSEQTVGRIAFSPGPWKAEGWSSIVIDGFPRKVVGGGAYDGRWMEPGEAEANARLMAAAPDLLEALKALTAQCEIEAACPDETCDCPAATAYVQAKAAIAKAEGR